MKTVNTILVLVAAFVAVFLEAAVGTRGLLGAQLDLLPVIIVYASLYAGLGGMTLVAVLGGLAFDSLSANRLGVSMLPLFLIGFVIHRKQELILRDQLYAQFILGLAACGTAPLLTLLLLYTTGATPAIGWGSLWQWLVMTLGGGLLTPVCFRLFGRLNRTFFYQPEMVTSFRPDRQIRRGRH